MQWLLTKYTYMYNILVLKAGHPGVLVIVCFVFVLFGCGVLGLGFLSSLPL